LKTSVIIATHARPASVARLIASLAPGLASGIREVIVAENGTPSPTQFPGALAPFKHLHEPRPGKCRIQNRAIAEAPGELLVFLDDDLIVAPGYLDAVESFFDSHREFAGMRGRILPEEDPDKKVGPMAVYLDLPIADDGDQVIEVRGVLGANMAFRATALRQVGPFDERLGPGAGGHEEETEMSARLRSAGFRIGYAPEALVYHEVDRSRADRERFIRIARERRRCRMLHEEHSAIEVIIAREERRLAIARGMFDGLRGHN